MSSTVRRGPSQIASWVLRIGVGVALILMGAIPKLTGDAISIELFEQLGQPWARLPVGVMELVGALLMIVPKTAFLGALGVAATMVGAVGSHVVGPLGIHTMLTNPETGVKEELPLFPMAIAFLIMAVVVAFLERPGRPSRTVY